MFRNPEIALDELPTTGLVTWQILDPAFKRLNQVIALLVAIGAAIPLTLVTVLAGLPVVLRVVLWAAWIVASAAMLNWPGVAVPKRGYVIRDKDILFKKGVVWRSVTAVPFNRIQHVETSSTPFDRKFGLATLQLFTAGGSSGDLKIDGLAEDTAEELRTHILSKAGASIEHA